MQKIDLPFLLLPWWLLLIWRSGRNNLLLGWFCEKAFVLFVLDTDVAILLGLAKETTMLFGLDKKVWVGLMKEAAILFGLGWEVMFGLVKEEAMMFGLVIEAVKLFCCLDIRVAILFETLLFDCLNAETVILFGCLGWAKFAKQALFSD